MDDLISRQAAIDAIDEYMVGKNCATDGTMMASLINELVIKQLPSVQFATDTNVGTKLGTNLAEVGTDLISRQAAIDALDEQIAQCNKAIKSFVLSMKDEYAVKVEKASLTAFRERLEYLPPAEPKKGKWIYHIDDLFPAESTMECNQCHAEQQLTCDDEFCPHCGAKMEVTE